MTILELKEIFEKCDIRTEKEISEQASFKELGVDSLDLSTIAYELEDILEREVKLDSSMKIGQLLEIMK